MNDSLQDNHEITSPPISSKGLRSLSLRDKIILAFAAPILLMILSLGITFINVSFVEDKSEAVIKHNYPATLKYLSLADDLNLATTFLNNYLLTRQQEDKKKYLAVQQKLIKQLQIIHAFTEYDSANEAKNNLYKVNKKLGQFQTFGLQLIDLRDNDEKNNVGLAQAAELLNPSILEFLGLTSNLILEVKGDVLSKRQQDKLVLLAEIRYTWVRMFSSMRLYFNLRSESMLNNLDSFIATNRDQISKLKNMKVEIGIDGVAEMDAIATTFRKNLPVVMKTFQTEAWRADINLMKLKVRPLVNELRDLLQNLADKQVQAAKVSGAELTGSVTKIRFYAVLLLLLSVLMASFFAVIILRRILPNLSKLTAAVQKVAAGDLETEVKIDSKDEFGLVGTCFNDMVSDLRSAAKDKENYVGQLEILSKELEERVQRRTAQLAKTNEELKESSRLKSEFMSNMSHELRTPLNAIIGFSGALIQGLDGPLNEEQTASAKFVEDGGKHLLGLVNDILDLSKIEAGKMELHKEETETVALIQDVMKTVSVLYSNKGLTLSEEFTAGLPNIFADKTRLRQVLLNLLSNAAKFTEEGGVVVNAHVTNQNELNQLHKEALECSEKNAEHWMIMSVSDSGIGIKEEDIHKVFEEFRQVDSGHTRKEGGTGLGMAISKRFVEMHGGTLWIESEVGKGSTFYFILPLEGEDDAQVDQAVEVSSTISHAPKHKSPKVLVVEDDVAVMALYRKHLNESGYDVYGMEDGIGVVEQAISLGVKIVLLDIMLPHKDGWQILQELHENKKTENIPVVVCSALSERNLGMSLGADAYLVKPVEGSELLSIVNKFTTHSRAHILAMDDDPVSLALVKKMLATEDLDFSFAADGEHGLEMVHAEKPDLILLDLMMPKVDGFAVLKKLKEDKATQNIPIIILTAKDLETEEEEKILAKADIILHKGHFTQDELIDRVSHALEHLEEGET